jgi:hypothetical protein
LITLVQHALDQMLTFGAATTPKKPVKFSWLFTLTQHVLDHNSALQPPPGKASENLYTCN